MKRQTDWINFRVSEQEKKKIKRCAEKKNKHVGELVREQLLAQPFYECPQFDSCSCNKCPLDPEYKNMIALPGEERCKAQKPTRMKIGEKYQSVLPLKGLTCRESQGKKIWDRKTPTEKKQMLERGVKALKTLRRGN